MKEELKSVPTVIQQQEFVEVERNTKGYNFTVRILGIDLGRLKELTDELNRMYPNIK